MSDELEQLKAKVAELEAKIVALTQPQPKPRVDVARLQPPFSPSTYAALDRMSVPREITDEMARNVGTAMVREIVRDGRR